MADWLYISLIPVCLNSLLYHCEMQMAVMYQHKENRVEANRYQQLAAIRKTGIRKYCLSEKEGVFTDYQFIKQEHNPVISLAMIYPLFFELATQQEADKTAAVIEENFLKAGGLVTTLNTSGEQWDAPNGWAPLQWLAVMGLDKYQHTTLARIIAIRWLQVNETVYLSEHKMMEKYNVENPGIKGGGGNYENQDGFG